MGNVFGLFGPRLEMTGQAWGCCAERPTMILYGIDNIRDLFGHKLQGCTPADVTAFVFASMSFSSASLVEALIHFSFLHHSLDPLGPAIFGRILGCACIEVQANGCYNCKIHLVKQGLGGLQGSLWQKGHLPTCQIAVPRNTERVGCLFGSIMEAGAHRASFLFAQRMVSGSPTSMFNVDQKKGRPYNELQWGLTFSQ
eukprot:205260-Pelagomonas_calceolata.AAC.2